MPPNVVALEFALQRLHSALQNGRSNRYCLDLWSRFVRLRDGNQCVACHAEDKLSAHHIVRKSFLKEAHLQTGNGITLCSACHKAPHEAFNRRPDLTLPMDAEGGEKIEILTVYFWLLLSDAKSRCLLRDDFYYLSDQVLQKFKLFQDFPPATPFSGNRLEQAFLIWRQTPRNMLDAVLRANEFILPREFIQSGELIVFYTQ